MLALLVAAACMVGVISSGAFRPATVGNGTTPTTGARSTTAAGSPVDAAALAARTDPTLVDIDTVIGNSDMEGLATGMVLSSTGEIVTNNHVIEGETSVSVRDVGNGRTYHGTVLGYDRAADIAVIQLDGASGLRTIERGSSYSLSAGQGIVTVGNAGGNGGTPAYAAGSVVALNQSITAVDQVTETSERLSGLIETNAAVEQGDSGGALVGAAGHVVGMTVAGSEGFQVQGTAAQGFAIPLNEVLGVAGEIVAHEGSSTIHVGPTAFLGVATKDPTLGTGAEVIAVASGSPAATAGLMPGDVITAVGQVGVGSSQALTDVMVRAAPGTSVQVRYTDFTGAATEATVRLATGPPQ